MTEEWKKCLLCLDEDDAQTLRAYLADGVPANAADENGKTLLMSAAQRGAPRCVRELLVAGAAVGLCDNEGRTALHMAADSFSWNWRKPWCRPASCVSMLLEAGADPHLVDEGGKNPLERAASWSFSTNHAAVFCLLRLALSERQSPVMQAVWNADVETLGALIQQGHDVNVADESGYTPLHMAVLPGRTVCLPPLLAAGAQTDAVSRGGNTPLMLATWAVDAAAAQQLLAAGASPDQKDAEGRTPLMRAVKLNNAACVRALLAAGADVHATDEFQSTALHDSVSHPEMMQLLLAAGANPDCTDKHGATPLKECVNTQHFLESLATCARLLIEAGADVNLPEFRGIPPLCWACSEREGRFISLLLAAGADVHHAAHDGRTALHWAAESYNAAGVRLLLAAGADPSIKDNTGMTPRDYARGRDWKECRDLLSSALVERGIPLVAGPVMKVSAIRTRLRRKAVLLHSAVPEQPPVGFASWLGRVTHRLPGESWPTDAEGKPLVPLATLYINDLPYIPAALRKLALITIFAPEEPRGGVDAGCVIRTYTSTEGLEPCDYTAADMTPCVLTPEPVKNDMPRTPACGGSEEMWDAIADIERAQGIDYQESIMEAEYDTHKIGGYPGYTQEAPEVPGGYSYVFQLCSDWTAGLSIGDLGNYYFYYNSRQNAWRVHMDCY